MKINLIHWLLCLGSLLWSQPSQVTNKVGSNSADRKPAESQLTPVQPQRSQNRGAVPSATTLQPSNTTEDDESDPAEAELDEMSSALYGADQLQELGFAVRFDSAFLSGNGLVQGFTLRSARLSVFGDLSPHLSYRFSLGQTREFATVLLPQITPVEAYVDLSSRALMKRAPRIAVRTGMFTPEFHPLWTPDLSYLTLPSYHESHQLMFLSRELGIQVAYESSDDSFKGGLAYVNGVGILSENTNNAKSLVLFVKNTLDFGSGAFSAGISAFGRLQSSKGNLNFREDWLSLAWASFRYQEVTLLGEFFLGQFESSTLHVRPRGGAIYAAVDFGLVGLWGRYEWVNNAPNGATQTFTHWQAGPILELNPALLVFAGYGELNQGLGLGLLREFRIQLRLNL